MVEGSNQRIEGTRPNCHCLLWK